MTSTPGGTISSIRSSTSSVNLRRVPSGAQAQVWDQMHALQAKIRTSANWSYDEAKKGVGYLGTQIQYMGQQMQNFGGSGAKNGSK